MFSPHHDVVSTQIAISSFGLVNVQNYRTNTINNYGMKQHGVEVNTTRTEILPIVFVGNKIQPHYTVSGKTARSTGLRLASSNTILAYAHVVSSHTRTPS